MKVVSKDIATKDEVERSIPMHKDHVYMANLRVEFIAMHNRSFERKNKDGNNPSEDQSPIQNQK